MNEAWTPILDAFQRALRRETHNLSRRPDLFWQQLHNRLQWEGGALEARLARQRRDGRAPWIRTRAPFRESRALVRTLTGHRGAVNGCAVTPDGSLIVSAGDESLRTWDIATGQARDVYTAGFDLLEAHACAIGPDGSVAVAAGRGSGETMLVAWDLKNRRPLAAMRGEPGADGVALSCAIAPDGSLVASTGRATVGAVGGRSVKRKLILKGHTGVRLWDLPTGAARAKLRQDAHEVGACAISSDGSFLVTGGARVTRLGRGPSLDRQETINPTLEIWDLRKRRRRGALSGHDSLARACAVSADARLVVSAGDDGALRIWDVPARWRRRELHEPRAILVGDAGAINACAISPDGALLAAACDDGTVRLWDAVAGEQRARLVGHTGPVLACAFAPSGRLLVSGGSDRTVRVWQATAAEHEGPPAPAEPVDRCAFGADGSTTLTTGRRVRIIDTETGEERASAGADDGVRACVPTRDTRYLLSCGRDGKVRLLNASSAEEEAMLGTHIYVDAENDDWANRVDGPEPAWDCAVSPNGEIGASMGSDNMLRIWDLETRRQRAVASGGGRLSGAPGGCALSPDLSLALATDPEASVVRVWDLMTLEERDPLPCSHPASCAMSPDGGFAVVAGEELQTWDAAEAELLGSLEGHAGRVNDCAVSPDGALVASAGADATVRIWSADGEGELAALALPAAVRCVAFHPRKPLLACAEGRGGLHFIDLIGIDYGPLVVTAMERAGQAVFSCPRCGRESAAAGSLGRLVACVRCGSRLRIGPSPAKRPAWLRSAEVVGFRARLRTGHQWLPPE